MNDDLQHSWSHAWAELDLPAPPGLMDELLAAYGQPHRHYHSRQHLAECLAHFREVRHLARHPAEVALALWFHDAIYEPKATANEQRSADWAATALRGAGASQGTQDRVWQLVKATRHDAQPTDPDQQLLVDIDLAILGAAPERFAEYDRQVRAEYRWVPGLVYAVKRKAVLRAFLARPHIYSTEHFRATLESQARRNLAQYA